MADKPIVITDIVVQPPDTAAQGEEGAAQIVINAQIDGLTLPCAPAACFAHTLEVAALRESRDEEGG